MSDSRQQRRERARRMLNEPVLVGSGALPTGGTYDVVAPAERPRTVDEQRQEFERMADLAVQHHQVLILMLDSGQALLDVHGGDRRAAERWMAAQARRSGQGVAAVFPTEDPTEWMVNPETSARLPYVVSFAAPPTMPEAETRSQLEEACQVLVASVLVSLGEED